MSLYLTDVQKQLTIELLRDRYLMLVDMAANAADCGDIHSHGQLSDEYWEINQAIKKLEN